MSGRIIVPLALLLGASLMIGFLDRFARSMIYPGSPVPFPTAEALARELPSARLVELRTADGLDLRGAHVPAADPAAPVVVYFHGNAESASENLPFAADLARQGIGVFLAEYRGYGGLPGEPTEEGLYADGEAAVRAAREIGVPPERLVLMGRSLGSGVATEMAVRHPCALLVLISPYTSMAELAKGIAGPWAGRAVPDRYDNLEKIGRVRCPVVLLHGSRDDIIPVAMARALADAAPGATLVEAPTATHNVFPGLEELVAREIHRMAGAPRAAE